MSEELLKPQQRRALIQLAFQEGRVEKVGDLKPDLDTQLRKALIDQKLLKLENAARGKALELTDSGWRWVMEHLDSELPQKEQVAKLLMEVLKRLHKFLGANAIDVQDVIFARKIIAPENETYAAPSSPSLISANQALLRAADELGGAHAPQIRLRDLRPKLQGFSREQVDTAIRELQIEEVISVIPIDLPTDINDDDRQASIEIAGKPRHAIIVRGR